MSVWLALALAVAAPPAPSAGARSFTAPLLDGGSTVRVKPAGRLEVRTADGARLRWAVGLGGPAAHVLADDRCVYAVTGRYLRAFAGGVSRWALDLGDAPLAVEARFAGGHRHLRVRLPVGAVWVDADHGRFCTPRQPCGGLEGASPEARLGAPWLDLARVGLPGFGLLLDPELLARGEPNLVAPGAPAGLAAPPAPRASSPPRARSYEAGPTISVTRGRSGKARTLTLGGTEPAGAAPAP